MKRLVKRISLPLMLLVGLILIGPQTAEAARRGYSPAYGSGTGGLSLGKMMPLRSQ